MPIYEYACPDCGNQFDALQKFSDEPITNCPKCAAANVKKKVSATSFVLKGGGWYKDHYGLKPGGADSASKAESAPAATPATPTPSTPAPTSPAAAPSTPSAPSTPASGSSS